MKAELLDEAKRLTVEERIEFVEAIWDTLSDRADVGDIPVTEAQRAELDRRLEDWRSDPGVGRPDRHS